jgi:hypothetical protein
MYDIKKDHKGDVNVMAKSIVNDAIQWINTDYFREPAIHYSKHGFYNDAPYGSKDYVQYLEEHRKRSLEGYSVGGARITGYNNWFLNWSPMNIVKDPSNKASKKVFGFPRFWNQHFDFFHHIEKAEQQGKHFPILKPRGTGFSEIFSSMGTRDYTLVKRSKSFYFAANEGFLNKDGIITKCWDKLEFLNQNTNRMFRHLRQVKNQDLHKRASEINDEGDEIGYLSEIIGRVIDHPRKVRGARTGTYGKVYMEEGGSFPRLRESVQATRPLVEQGGVSTGQIILWGTGGEDGAGIEGLDHIFYHPQAYNMYEMDNVWDEDRVGTKSGYFFPCYAAMDRFTDDQGNNDEKAARDYHDKERARIKSVSPKEEDHYRAEYPFSPREALTRMRNNLFPVAELQRQLTRVKTDPGIQGFLKYGWIHHTEEGLRFKIDPKAVPLKEYPNLEKDTTGCITMVESPFKGAMAKVPDDMYSIVLDMYYKDEASDSPSLGAAYVYKHMNDVSQSEGSILVAWYVARPATTQEYIRNLFMLARFYNARIQSEIAGGGKAVIDYARIHKLLHLCELEPDIILNNQSGQKKNKSFFMNVNKDLINLALSYYSDHLKEERSLIEAPNGELISTLNLHKIYDEGLLEELIKYNDEGNFDRVSALRLLPFMIKERVNVKIEANKQGTTFWDRPLFTDQLVSMENIIPPSDLVRDIDRTDYNS